MTDLESPKKNNDCYFYYYSTCSKGDSCGFRHEPSALGCETTCSFWKEGKCLNVHCNFRHMELRKNRKAIPCYWESQPGGCLKPHCPFMHQNLRLNLADNNISKSDGSIPENCTQATKTASPDSLVVVQFEEESDSESVSMVSPEKIGISKMKTTEEIQLEKIAAESASFYSYTDTNVNQPLSEEDLRQKLINRVKSSRGISNKRPISARLGFEDNQKMDSTSNDSLNTNKRRKIAETNIEDIKIKTLEEIRAERLASRIADSKSPKDSKTKNSKHSPIRLSRELEESITENEEAEVSSTIDDEPDQFKKTYDNSIEQIPTKPLRRLNIKKNKTTQESVKNYKQDEINEDKTSVDLHIGHEESLENVENFEVEDKTTPTKTIDESLLLDDTEEDFNINMKSEEELWGDIDNLLDD
ncbi:hypothetical protein ABEB36_005269 [Hypothenemus hampei]